MGLELAMRVGEVRGRELDGEALSARERILAFTNGGCGRRQGETGPPCLNITTLAAVSRKERTMLQQGWKQGEQFGFFFVFCEWRVE